MTTQNTKVNIWEMIEAINFGFSENKMLANKTAYSLEEGNEMVSNAALNIKHQGYDKTDVEIILSDSTVLVGRLDVMQRHAWEDTMIQNLRVRTV